MGYYRCDRGRVRQLVAGCPLFGRHNRYIETPQHKENHMKKTILTAAIAMLLLSGCVSINKNDITGDAFTMADVEALQPGITTLEEVKAKLGKPAAYSYKDNGETGVVWSHTRINVSGNQFDMKSSAYSVSTGILFSKEGIMIRIASKSEYIK